MNNKKPMAFAIGFFVGLQNHKGQSILKPQYQF